MLATAVVRGIMLSGHLIPLKARYLKKDEMICDLTKYVLSYKTQEFILLIMTKFHTNNSMQAVLESNYLRVSSYM